MGDNNLVEAGFDPEFGCDNGDARGHGSEQSVVAGDTVRGSERYGAAGTYRDECDRDSEQSVAAGTNERGANLRRAIVELLGAEAWCNGSLNREFIAAKVFSDKSLLASLNAIVHPIVAQDFEAWATTLESPARGMKERANVAAMALESPPAPTPPTIASQKTDPKTTSKAEAGTPPYLIMESAILFESGFNHLVDKVIAVSAPEELRIARVMARSSATEPNNPATARSSATPSGSNSTRNPETARVPGMASGRGPSRDDVIKRMSNQLSESELIARADYTIYNGGDLMQLAARVSELDKLLRLGDAKKNSPPQPKKQK
ncbi:MAG: dephospho-CoA kinase [Alistipes sp.]|nr:dephospho-CoA kinase [Alistipes sp.]